MAIFLVQQCSQKLVCLEADCWQSTYVCGEVKANLLTVSHIQMTWKHGNVFMSLALSMTHRDHFLCHLPIMLSLIDILSNDTCSFEHPCKLYLINLYSFIKLFHILAWILFKEVLMHIWCLWEMVKSCFYMMNVYTHQTYLQSLFVYLLKLNCTICWGKTLNKVCRICL